MNSVVTSRPINLRQLHDELGLGGAGLHADGPDAAGVIRITCDDPTVTEAVLEAAIQRHIANPPLLGAATPFPD